MSDSLLADSARLEFQQLLLPNGLKIERISVEATKTGLENSSLCEEPPRVVAVLNESDLAAFIQPKLPPPVRSVDVQLVGGRIQVAAIAKVLIEVTALLILRLEVVEQKEIHLRIESVDAPGPLEGIIENRIQDQNPIFEAKDVPIPIEILGTRIEAGKLEIDARLTQLTLP